MLKKKIQELFQYEQHQKEKKFEIIYEDAATQIVGGACMHLGDTCGTFNTCGNYTEPPIKMHSIR